MYDKKTTIQYLEMRFPHLTEELHDETWDGLLHLQVAVFARWAQDVIDSQDNANWAEIMDAFRQLWQNCNSDVANALNVSFLEHLNFSDGKIKRSWAYDAMPPLMQDAWNEMEDYNRQLHGH